MGKGKTYRYVVSAEAVAKAIGAANTLREEFGVGPIDELPLEDTRPGHASQCVLARAFNFSCSIAPQGDEWYATFPWERREHAKLLARELGTTAEASPALAGGAHRVRLPAGVANIALAFDRYELEPQLEEMK